MLDANLYSLKFVKSAIEPDKTFLINESDGEPVYFRLKSAPGDDNRIELYHSLTLAPLGSYQNVSSKLKLISLKNPNLTIELRNTGYITWEWTFEFQDGIKFSWRKDIVGLSPQKRGFTLFMVRKPDPDYPCAIYRPGSSTSPATAQLLDFNIRRIENLFDGRGLEHTIILSLLGFTEALADYESKKVSPNPSPPVSNSDLRSSSRRPPPIPKPISMDYDQPTVEANELIVSDSSSNSEIIGRGLRLFKDPLFLYLFVHSPSSNGFKNAVTIANEIKLNHFKRTKEDLHQYLVDDIMAEGKTKESKFKSKSLKIYLSRTPLDELLPKEGVTKSSSSITNNTKSSSSSSSTTTSSSLPNSISKNHNRVFNNSNSSSKSNDSNNYNNNLNKVSSDSENDNLKGAGFGKAPDLPPKNYQDSFSKLNLWSGIHRRVTTNERIRTNDPTINSKNEKNHLNRHHSLNVIPTGKVLIKGLNTPKTTTSTTTTTTTQTKTNRRRFSSFQKDSKPINSKDLSMKSIKPQSSIRSIRNSIIVKLFPRIKSNHINKNKDGEEEDDEDPEFVVNLKKSSNLDNDDEDEEEEEEEDEDGNDGEMDGDDCIDELNHDDRSEGGRGGGESVRETERGREEVRRTNEMEGIIEEIIEEIMSCNEDDEKERCLMKEREEREREGRLKRERETKERERRERAAEERQRQEREKQERERQEHEKQKQQQERQIVLKNEDDRVLEIIILDEEKKEPSPRKSSMTEKRLGLRRRKRSSKKKIKDQESVRGRRGLGNEEEEEDQKRKGSSEEIGIGDYDERSKEDLERYGHPHSRYGDDDRRRIEIGGGRTDGSCKRKLKRMGSISSTIFSETIFGGFRIFGVGGRL